MISLIAIRFMYDNLSLNPVSGLRNNISFRISFPDLVSKYRLRILDQHPLSAASDRKKNYY